MANQDKWVPYQGMSGSKEDLVLRIVGDHLGIPGPALSLSDHIIEDLGADSLDRLELIMTIEELFDIKIAADKISAIDTIGDIVSAVKITISKDRV